MNKRRKDRYYRRAKSEGYSSRASYKLLQIDKNHKLFTNKDTVLDLCCAPGSWSEYLLRKYRNINIIGVDIQHVNLKNQNARFLRKNLMDDDFMDFFKEKVGKEKPFLSVVVSDCAPKFGSSATRNVDLFRQHELSMRALECCKEFLLSGGNCVIKSFQGLPQESSILKKALKELFQDVFKTKPDSSRKTSPEFYYIGKRKK